MATRHGVTALAAVLAAVPAVRAQTSTTVGPVIGVNFSTFGGSDADDIGTRTAFLVGGFAAFGLSRRFTLEPSLLYTQKGGEAVFENDVQGTIKLDYVQVPLLGRLRFPSGSVTPNFLFGPAIGFRTSCSASASQGPIEVNIDCDEAEFQISSTDFSLIAGVGLEVGPLLFSLRYDYGLTAVPSEGNADVFNRAWSLVAQYGFRLR